ncbi:hypothetical protein [Haladaptatus sp. DYF46]|uniref:hypothetical protein n=1 Tax=Haladaptatus sp. DYF46 TaxID=2886041 RepID=UPI001E5392E6|nr:hypothetical protein [Haladaptatus sp. DYF46]
MEHTIRLQDGADLELTDIGIATDDEHISFSIDGRIEGVNDELMDALSGKSLTLTAVTFQAEASNSD